MARVTVSLPDELALQLDDYAHQHAESVSGIVQTALKNLFAGTPTPTPSPTPAPNPPPAPAPAPSDDPDAHKRLEEYIAKLAYKMEHMREGLWCVSQCLGHTMRVRVLCPRQIPLPPWPHQPPPGWGTGWVAD